VPPDCPVNFISFVWSPHNSQVLCFMNPDVLFGTFQQPQRYLISLLTLWQTPFRRLCGFWVPAFSPFSPRFCTSSHLPFPTFLPPHSFFKHSTPMAKGSSFFDCTLFGYYPLWEGGHSPLGQRFFLFSPLVWLPHHQTWFVRSAGSAFPPTRDQ